jgi:hypothetical protein
MISSDKVSSAIHKTCSTHAFSVALSLKQGMTTLSFVVW